MLQGCFSLTGVLNRTIDSVSILYKSVSHEMSTFVGSIVWSSPAPDYENGDKVLVISDVNGSQVNIFYNL